MCQMDLVLIWLELFGRLILDDVACFVMCIISCYLISARMNEVMMSLPFVPLTNSLVHVIFGFFSPFSWLLWR